VAFIRVTVYIRCPKGIQPYFKISYMSTYVAPVLSSFLASVMDGPNTPGKQIPSHARTLAEITLTISAGDGAEPAIFLRVICARDLLHGFAKSLLWREGVYAPRRRIIQARDGNPRDKRQSILDLRVASTMPGTFDLRKTIPSRSRNMGLYLTIWYLCCLSALQQGSSGFSGVSSTRAKSSEDRPFRQFHAPHLHFQLMTALI